jgi:uncharacterized protein (DUF433 family)
MSKPADRVEIDPRVMMGKPRLQREDIRAAIGYAADSLAHEETIFLRQELSEAS